MDNAEAEIKLKRAAAGYIDLRAGRTSKASWWCRISKKEWLEDWKQLTPAQRAIMITLRLYLGKKDFSWPSQETLAEDLNLSIITIKRNIKCLAEKGLIRIEKVKGKKSLCNRYWLRE